MSLIDDLKNQELYTKSELPVIDYIIKNHNKVIKMSISELAKATYSSNPAIIRICKKLGFSGYKEFKMIYAMNIASIKYINTDIDYSVPFSNEESTLEIINSMASLYKNTIDLINSQLDINEIEAISDLLNNSHNVFIFATGDTNITAQGFVNKLIKIGKFFHITNMNGEQIHYASQATKDDVCIFITYDGPTTYMESLRRALVNRCKIIVITANKKSMLVKYANYNIFIPHQEDNQKIATFYSQQAFSYILNIIYSIMYQRKK